MKKLWLRSLIVPALYLLVYIYFAVFNWQIFIVNLNIDLGFGSVDFPPFVVLFLVGFILVSILAWVYYMSSVRRLIHDLEQGLEYGKMKDKLVTTRFQEMLFDNKNVEHLKSKMGVQELRRRQEEILAALSDMGRAREQERTREQERAREQEKKQEPKPITHKVQNRKGS